VGFDLDYWTVRVLEHGLPPAPQRLKPSETIALARWRGTRHGAVLFIRLWRNGQFDSEVAITERNPDGSWAEPSMSAGGPWIDEPLVRPSAGWDGDPVLWLGMTGSGECIAVRGAAAKTIAAIGVEHAGRHSQFEIESPSGAFVVGVENPQQPVLFGLDHEGRRVDGAAFRAVIDDFPATPDNWPDGGLGRSIAIIESDGLTRDEPAS
jgi:hypothetical protein